MHAEIIATGSELLLGEVVDTNSPYIARRLREIGLNLYYKTIVGDNEQRMEEALRIALNRSDVIITTGGLGPTVDDVTRPAVARAV
ncbi:MAG: competence/damage-inducible protein A, partial [Chloroflexi bacterium]|nr:competence/damage-inducible protein A [Chloroflexota bacterium]